MTARLLLWNWKIRKNWRCKSQEVGCKISTKTSPNRRVEGIEILKGLLKRLKSLPRSAWSGCRWLIQTPLDYELRLRDWAKGILISGGMTRSIWIIYRWRSTGQGTKHSTTAQYRNLLIHVCLLVWYYLTWKAAQFSALLLTVTTPPFFSYVLEAYSSVWNQQLNNKIRYFIYIYGVKIAHDDIINVFLFSFVFPP